jgi:dipeptide/tripeptide permease
MAMKVEDLKLSGAQEPLADSFSVPSKQNKLWSVCGWILIVEVTERLCFYTVYPTFNEYLINAGVSNAGAGAMKQSFRMLAYLFPLVGGYLADNVLGRYKTILSFTICYVFGVALIAVGAVQGLLQSGVGLPIFLIGSFVFTAVGTGAIKPNVVNFGAEQYNADDPVEAEQQKAFFSYFYMVINIGGTVASVWLAGLAVSQVTNSSPGMGFFYAYLVSAVAMCISLLAFIAGTGRYSADSKAIPTRKPMVSIVRKHLVEGASGSARGKIALLGWILVPIYLCVNLVGSLLPSGSLPMFFGSGGVSGSPGMSVLQVVALVLSIVSCGLIIFGHLDNEWIKPLRNGANNGITTEEVKGFLRALPTIICVTVGFNLCYNGMDVYPLQACQMDTRTGLPQAVNNFFFLGNGQFNGTFFGLGDNAAILICIPLFEAVIFPALRRKGITVSRKAKFNAGFFFAILGCVIGIILEAVRKTKPLIGCNGAPDDQCFCSIDWENLVTPEACAVQQGDWLLVSQCAPKGSPMSQMTAWWTFIPFWLTGMGEVLVNPVIQEFSFDEVSPRLKSLLMGVTMVVMGCIPSVMEGALCGFIPDNLNVGNVDMVFYVFIALSLILLVVYWCVALPEKTRTHEVDNGV